MSYCITLRSRTDALITGWYDGSESRWSTDRYRQKIFENKRDARPACDELRSLCPRNAEVINIEAEQDTPFSLSMRFARRYRRQELHFNFGQERARSWQASLVLDFAREFLPVDYDEVRHIFSRRGAYRRYKDLLVQRGALDRWYDFSNKSEETALREWCAENGIELTSQRR